MQLIMCISSKMTDSLLHLRIKISLYLDAITKTKHNSIKIKSKFERAPLTTSENWTGDVVIWKFLQI